MRTITSILIFVTLIPSLLAEPVYDVVDLGILSEGLQSYAQSINNNGQIVGYTHFWGESGSFSVDRATLFDSTGNGNNIYLGSLGGDNSQPSSINNNGQIVGNAQKEDFYVVATLFDPTGGGNNINLGTISPGRSSIASAINNNGQIVGSSSYLSNNTTKRHAALFDLTGNGNNIDLGTFGGNNSEATSINDNGQIVGSAGEIADWSPASWKRAALFDPTGGGNNIDLGTLGGTESSAFSINNNGQIVGSAENNLGYGRATLFDITGAGNNIDLSGELPENLTSSATSINNDGQIVGWVHIDPYTTEERATLFDPTGGGNNIDLNTLINPALGWTLNFAYGINDNGWIVGRGINSAGQKRAFLLIPRNKPPVANAGSNQTVYVCGEDELAEVILDGSGSFDEDGDDLDYFWSWIIDSNLYEANGISPTIQLPIGEHQIELVVDDGTEESEPNYCTINVVGPVKAKLFCMPQMLNTQMRYGIVTAMICLPKGITPADIDANEPLTFIPGKVESKRQFAFQRQQQTWIIASFKAGDCLGNLAIGMNKIKVTGYLKSGQCYYGNSCIFVYKPKPFRWPWMFH